MFLFINDFLVAQRCESFRVPVDHTHAAVDEAFFIKVAEHVYDALRANLIHCERGTFPVAGATEFAELFEDDAAVFMCPIPSVLKEFLASDIGLLDALLSQLVHDFCFCCDGSMVGTRHPACVLALHTRTTDEDVLNRVVQHVTHVKHACDIRRRNHDGVRFTFIRCRMKIVLFHPVLVPFLFGRLRTIFARKFHNRKLKFNI